MQIKLIRMAMVLIGLIGAVMVMRAAEFDAGLGYTLGALAVMFIGMIGLGLSCCISIKGR